MKPEIALRTKWAGQRLVCYESTDSTNLRAKQEAAQGAPHGTVVVADMQTAGRGRRGRAWESPAGVNLYFTILLRPDRKPDDASMLTIVTAHAVAEGIRRTIKPLINASERGAGKQYPAVGIKWPNDIVIDGKKVCGILAELDLEGTDLRDLVIGVGVNVRGQRFAPEISDKAVSLEDAYECEIDRIILLENILQVFETDYESLQNGGNLASLREDYNAMLVNRDREVCVLDPAGEYRGTARGVTERGELLVELPDGSLTKVYAGEVSVRGVYGYV